MIVTLPRDEATAGNRYCSNWDRVFHPHKICPNPHPTSTHASTSSKTRPAASAYTTYTYNTPVDNEGGAPGEVIFLTASLGVLFSVFAIAVFCCLNKNCKRKASSQQQARARRGVQPPPSLQSRLSTWWNQSRRGGREGRRDIEMGRIKRSLSRVRSIAKPTPPEIQVPAGVIPRVQTPNTRQPAQRARNITTPPAHPPTYDHISRGSHIADQFMPREQRDGVEEERMETPPPSYQQGTGDRYFWEGDETPAPEYSRPFTPANSENGERSRGHMFWR